MCSGFCRNFVFLGFVIFNRVEVLECACLVRGVVCLYGVESFVEEEEIDL